MLDIRDLLGEPCIIRPSSLPSFADCERRTAAQLFKPLIVSAGYELRILENNIGAVVGRSVHSGAAFTLETKVETGELGSDDDAGAAAMEEYGENVADGVMWDTATPGRNDGERQILRMVRCYREHLAPGIDPISVEERLKCDLGDGFILSGQTDAVVRELSGGIRDLKTGVVKRANGAQYGSYSLLVRAHGGTVESLTEDYIQRIRMKVAQPDPVSESFDVAACENAAVDTIADMKAGVEEFVRRMQTGDRPPEGAFRANPQSMLCSARYCSAHGTKFCRLHKGVK